MVKEEELIGFSVRLPEGKKRAFDRLCKHYGWSRAETFERLFDMFQRVENLLAYDDEYVEQHPEFSDSAHVLELVTEAAMLVPPRDLDAEEAAETAALRASKKGK